MSSRTGGNCVGTYLTGFITFGWQINGIRIRRVNFSLQLLLEAYLALRLGILHLSSFHFGSGVFLAIAWIRVAWIARFSWCRRYLGYLLGLTLFGTMYTHLAAFITLLAHLNVEDSLDKSLSAASQKRKRHVHPDTVASNTKT